MWVRSSWPPKSWMNLAEILILYCGEVQTSRAFYKHLRNSHFYHDLWLRCLVSHTFLFLDLLLVLYLWKKSSCHAAGGRFLLLAPPGPNEHTHTAVAWSAGPWRKERGLRGGVIAWHRTLQTTQANGRKAPPIHLHLFFFSSCSCPTPELAHLPRQWYSDTYHLSGFLPFRLTRDFFLSQTSATLTSGADDADEENSCELSQYKVQALFKHSECIHCGQDYHYRHFYNEEAKVGRLLKVTQLVSIRGRIQNQGYEWHLLSAYYLSSAFI